MNNSWTTFYTLIISSHPKFVEQIPVFRLLTTSSLSLDPERIRFRVKELIIWYDERQIIKVLETIVTVRNYIENGVSGCLFCLQFFLSGVRRRKVPWHEVVFRLVSIRGSKGVSRV